MTAQQAERLHEALHLIETGKVFAGTEALRAILRDAGHPAPLFIVAARDRPPQGKER
jgi:hypothetical protein